MGQLLSLPMILFGIGGLLWRRCGGQGRQEMTGVRGIIFDCDGVLFASHQANLAYYNAVLAELGEPLVRPEEREKAHLCHTAATPQVFAGLLGAERVDAALAWRSPSIIAVLSHIWCRSRTWRRPWRISPSRLPLAIATNRGNSMAEILRHFGLRIISGRGDQPRRAPAQTVAGHASAGRRTAWTATGELLFVGDSELDWAAAQAAGIRFAAYKADLQGDLRVEGYRELLQFWWMPLARRPACHGQRRDHWSSPDFTSSRCLNRLQRLDHFQDMAAVDSTIADVVHQGADYVNAAPMFFQTMEVGRGRAATSNPCPWS